MGVIVINKLLKMKFIRLLNKYGVVGLIRKVLQRFLGIEKQQESVDALFYYLNNYLIDARLLPPTNDSDLRIMQKCDAALLVILDKICKKYNLTYWLDFGTLLGAQRHKGFIPWDDDMDVSILREDYYKLVPILKEELKGEDFDIKEYNGRIGFGYKHYKTGIWCDIFPVDFYKSSMEFEVSVVVLKKKIMKFRSAYNDIMNKKTREEIEKIRTAIINDEPNYSNSIIYHGREFNHLHPNAFYTYDEVFPLSSIEFEGYKLSSPRDAHTYLTKIFSENYLQVPRGGILHHDEGRGALSTWAKRNKIDMYSIYEYLINFDIK